MEKWSGQCFWGNVFGGRFWVNGEHDVFCVKKYTIFCVSKHFSRKVLFPKGHVLEEMKACEGRLFVVEACSNRLWLCAWSTVYTCWKSVVKNAFWNTRVLLMLLGLLILHACCAAGFMVYLSAVLVCASV